MVRMAILFLFVFYYSLALLNINSEDENPKARHCIEYSEEKGVVQILHGGMESQTL